jgi:hypothetical protein
MNIKINNASTLFFIFALSLICVCPKVLGQTSINYYQLDTVSFKFSELGKKPFLVLPDGKRIEISKAWLYPQKEVEEEQDFYVSSFNYLEPVTSFLIGKDLLGLHLSSWDYMPPSTGSAMAASGRDIFLVYNTKTQQLSPGILELGITKDRIRFMGCFFSTFHNFIIGDINNDGLIDIGVTLEKIWCEEKSDEERQIDFMSGPYYKMYPIEWYVLRGNKWEKSPQYNGIRPKESIMKLPLIGLKKSPVEFVREIYKEKLIEKE